MHATDFICRGKHFDNTTWRVIRLFVQLEIGSSILLFETHFVRLVCFRCGRPEDTERDGVNGEMYRANDWTAHSQSLKSVIYFTNNTRGGLRRCRGQNGNKPCNSIKDRLIINRVVCSRQCTCSKTNKNRSRQNGFGPTALQTPWRPQRLRTHTQTHCTC